MFQIQNNSLHQRIILSLCARGGEIIATKKPRYMISVNVDMFNEIEDFRFEKRFQTRSEATTELIRRGLESIKKEQAEEEED